MSETQKINPNENSTPKTSGFSTRQTLPAFEKNLVKKMKIRKAFAGLTYANNIIAVVPFLFTIVTLFGASSYGQPWWLGWGRRLKVSKLQWRLLRSRMNS